MILLNVFSVILINNADCIEISNKYATDTITKYCNITVLLPIKIVSSFFKKNVSNDMNNINNRTPLQSSKENKNSKKDDHKAFFQCAVLEDDSSSVQFGKKLSSGSLINVSNSYDYNMYCTFLAVSLILMFVVLFRGTLVLARGDTEDNIIIKNMEKLIRLV